MALMASLCVQLAMTGFQPISPRQIVSPSSISRSALLRTRAPPQMAAEIMMPALSSTMTEGKISQWLKSEGDKVEVGDMVLVVESDKADMDVEAYEEGYIAKILVPEGESALVGAPVAILVETEAEIAGAAAAGVVPTAAAASDGTVSADAVDVEMAQIMMPALSSTMTEGKISSWLVDIGDKVEVGDMLLVVESDKADMDVESYEEGYLAAILTLEGESALVGAPVGLLATNKEDIDKVAAAGANAGPNVGAAAAASATTVAPTVATTPSGGTAAVPAASGDRIVASPFAKTLAAEKGIDLSFVVGTGELLPRRASLPRMRNAHKPPHTCNRSRWSHRRRGCGEGCCRGRCRFARATTLCVEEPRCHARSEEASKGEEIRSFLNQGHGQFRTHHGR